MTLDQFRQAVEYARRTGRYVMLTSKDAQWLLENIDGIQETIIFAQTQLHKRNLAKCDDALLTAITLWEGVP